MGNPNSTKKAAKGDRVEQVQGPKRRWGKWWLVPVAVLAAIALAFYFSRQSLRGQRKLAEELKVLPDLMRYKAESRWPTSSSIKFVEKWRLSLPRKFVMLVLHTATDEDMAVMGRATDLRDFRLYSRKIGRHDQAYLDGLDELKWCDLDETHLSKAAMRLYIGPISRSSKPPAPGITDAGLAQLKGLRKLQYLQVAGHKITGSGLAHLGKLTELRYLSLYATEVNDAGMAHLGKFPELQKLSLARTKVTDAGLAHLKKLKNLDTLDLHGTQVTDAGLAHLKPLKRLTNLGLSGTPVTSKGVADLKSAIPELEVDFR